MPTSPPWIARWLRHGVLAIVLWELACAAVGIPIGIRAGFAVWDALGR